MPTTDDKAALRAALLAAEWARYYSKFEQMVPTAWTYLDRLDAHKSEQDLLRSFKRYDVYVVGF